MIGYIMVGTNDLDRAIKFYDELFKILDLERTETDDVCAGSVSYTHLTLPTTPYV